MLLLVVAAARAGAAQAEETADPGSLTNSIGMQLVPIRPGEFLMGSPPTEQPRGVDEQRHPVKITRAFYLGKYEVTQDQYERIAGSNPSYFAAGGGGADSVADQDTSQLPVETVSWDDAVEFCRLLSELPEEVEAGRVYRLPSEAEWEYACRAGTTTAFHAGTALGVRQANIDTIAGTRTVQVGSYAANPFGLHDMHGNVLEWCADWYDAAYYAASPREDPPGPATGTVRVLRGGSWGFTASSSRSANRFWYAPTFRTSCLGFRVAVTSAEQPAAPEPDPPQPGEADPPGPGEADPPGPAAGDLPNAVETDLPSRTETDRPQSAEHVAASVVGFLRNPT